MFILFLLPSSVLFVIDPPAEALVDHGGIDSSSGQCGSKLSGTEYKEWKERGIIFHIVK